MGRWAVVLIIAGCSTPSWNEVSFESSSGGVTEFEDCGCLFYDDNLDGVGSVEIGCSYGMFRSTQFTLGSQGVGNDSIRIQFSADNNGGTWNGTGTGTFSFLGAPHHYRDSGWIIRDIGGIELRWDAQTACDFLQGCGPNDKPVPAGAAHGGEGTCEDVQATIHGG